MGWQDRPYYRERGGSLGNPLMWLLTGSVRLFRVFGIQVRMHASMVLFIGMVLLLNVGGPYDWRDRLTSMAVLFGVVLLHEFGHCFAARWMGGEANEILMSPIGGLAMATPPRRPWPTFVTVAAGPMVNVLLCLVCGGLLWALARFHRLDPFDPLPPESWVYSTIHPYIYWVYYVSYVILLFNLLPIYPLDGGQMLQAILWPKLGYYRSMMFSCTTGIVGSVALGVYGLATFSLLLVLIAVSGFLTCQAMRRALRAAGPDDLESSLGLGGSLYEPEVPVARRRRRFSRRALRRARKLAMREQSEQARIDAILAKVSAQGMQSLTWWEKRALRKATERQRQRDLELSRGR